jgi:hypothetical protein
MRCGAPIIQYGSCFVSSSIAVVERELFELTSHPRLVASSLALIHAGAEEVRMGKLDWKAAIHALSLTIRDLFRA